MLEFTRSFNDVIIRMKQNGKQTYFSAYDATFALKLREKRVAVNKVAIEESGSFIGLLNWGSERIIFISIEYVIGLALKAEQDITKSFLKWLFEVSSVSKGFEQHDVVNSPREDSGAKFATTQIAKRYGLSAKTLNEILKDKGIQYKVNKQWVLHSEYQDQGLMKILKIPKSGDRMDEESIFHSYWTDAGVRFIESVLENLGYQPQGKQLSLF